MGKPKRFTVEAGRQICRDGKPFISIVRNCETTPCEADELAHIIAALLNNLGSKDIVTTYLGSDDGYVSSLNHLGEGSYSGQGKRK